MPKSQKSGKSGNKHMIRDRIRRKCQKYRANKTRERNKIKRVLRSNGPAAAQVYARLNGVALPKIAIRQAK